MILRIVAGAQKLQSRFIFPTRRLYTYTDIILYAFICLQWFEKHEKKITIIQTMSVTCSVERIQINKFSNQKYSKGKNAMRSSYIVENIKYFFFFFNLSGRPDATHRSSSIVSGLQTHGVANAYACKLFE